MTAQDKPHLNKLLEMQLAASPGQKAFLTKRFNNLSDVELAFNELLAKNIAKIVGDDVETFTSDYTWTCEQLLEEELYFRRHGKYRRSSFEEALRDVYSNDSYMSRYINGLLMTQLWWSNHSGVMRFYADEFIAGNSNDFRHLEVGAGHGLFLYFAANDPKCAHAEGWDVSASSIMASKAALERLDVAKMPVLLEQDLFDNPRGEFDSIVFSEVLEHLDRPADAMAVLRSLLNKDGRLFINMPINSPAPDHIFNIETPELLSEYLEKTGFRIISSAYYPATNQTMEMSRAKNLTISCAYILTPD